MASDDLTSTMAHFLRLLADEVENNKTMAKRLSLPFNQYINQQRDKPAKPARSTQKKADKAQIPEGFDPFLIHYEHGSVGLLSALAEMDAATCKAILSHFGLDPARTYTRWRSPERLANFIVQRVKAMSGKGKAFVDGGEQTETEEG